MVKTITFDEKGIPTKNEDKMNRSENMNWVHLDQELDKNEINLISYELSDLGITKDFIKTPRPDIISSDENDLIKLTFPREPGIYDNIKSNLTISIIATKNSIITISNYSEDIIEYMNEIFENKTQIKNTTNIFISIISKLINKSYETVESLDKRISIIRKNIFERNKSKHYMKQSEDIRKNIYNLHTLLLANLEIFEQIYNSKTIKHNNKIEHLENRILHLSDIIGGQKENLSRMSDLYLGVLSANTNDYMYKLTIFGSILLVPTLISSLYGMNVELPNLGFWSIVLLSSVLSLTIGVLVSYWVKK